jgi:hypothetical protein
MLLKTVFVGSSFALIATVALAQNNFNNNSGSFNYNNCSIFGNGNTLVCNPGRAGFSDELGAFLTSNMPDKTKQVTLRTVSKVTDQSVGNQVEYFLAQQGYSVQRTTIGMQAPPPKGPYTLQVEGNQYVLTVAPTAH